MWILGLPVPPSSEVHSGLACSITWPVGRQLVPCCFFPDVCGLRRRASILSSSVTALPTCTRGCWLQLHSQLMRPVMRWLLLPVVSRLPCLDINGEVMCVYSLHQLLSLLRKCVCCVSMYVVYVCVHRSPWKPE